jgi:hypothetical protein
LNSGEKLTIDIIMMVKQYAFTFDGLVLVEGDLYCYKIEWMLYDTKKILSIVLAFFGLFSQWNTMGLFFCLL